MPSHDYVPQRDGDLLIWANNIKVKLPDFMVQLGLTAGEATAAAAKANQIVEIINQNNEKQEEARQSTMLKKNTVATNIAALREVFKRGKTAAGYTNDVGTVLGIVGTDEPVDWAMFKPDLSAQTMPGHVVLKFKKGGAQGVNIYTRLNGTAAWEKLAFDSSSPYIDNRPVPPGASEAREYMCIAVVKDAEVSQMSDIVSVAVGG